MTTVKHTKIASEYYRSGYGRIKPRKANVYIIDGFAYAKDAATAKTDFNPLVGDLEGYVRVNSSGGAAPFYYEVSDQTFRDKHNPIDGH
jgi:hypothetical protein